MGPSRFLQCHFTSSLYFSFKIWLYFIGLCIQRCRCFVQRYVRCENYLLTKDSGKSPFINSRKGFVLRVIGTGVCLYGSTSKRDSMWHSPVFTCICPNRIPLNRINRLDGKLKYKYDNRYYLSFSFALNDWKGKILEI